MLGTSVDRVQIEYGYKFLSIFDLYAVISIIHHFVGDHFDRCTNLNAIIIYIGELGSDHRPFI